MVGVSREAATARRQAILAAVVAELATNGPHAPAVTAVAARAGTVPTAVYRRFPTTDALLTAAVDEHLAPTTSAWRAARASAVVSPAATSSTANRPAAPREVDAWAQLLVGGAWPGPAREPAKCLLATHRSASSSSPDASRLAAALDVGLWLVARGRGSAPRWDRRHGALLAAALDPAGPHRGARAPHITGAPGCATRHAAGGRPYLPVDDLGRHLLRATADVVAEQGPSAPIGVIVRRAGSSPGALYNRFSGKAGLLAEALTSRAPDVHDAVTALAAPIDDELFALRIAALVSAPSDPEVATAVAAVEQPAARALRRRLDPDRCEELPAATATTALVALPLGEWVVGRVSGLAPSEWTTPNARLAEHVGLAGGPTR